MRKKFNDTGNCISSKHFMVDTSQKLEEIFDYIEQGKYFTINRPRQFGKTTTLQQLYKSLKANPEYIIIPLSFQIPDDTMFDSNKGFCQKFVEFTSKKLKLQNLTLAQTFENVSQNVDDFYALGEAINAFVKAVDKKVVLTIDEVDEASNYSIFIKFLKMLREYYLLIDEEEGIQFFHSVILSGVTDIKHLKSNVRSATEKKFNSPWNIAADFDIDMSFSAPEIATMLTQYVNETGILMDISEIAKKLYYYTSGYPYLVSKMCKIIDEKILPKRAYKNWTSEDIEGSFKMLVRGDYSNNLFEEMIKNIFNHQDLYNLLVDIIINSIQIEFLITRPVISLATTYGIVKPNERGFCILHNLIFDKKFSDMILAEKAKENRISIANPVYQTEAGDLNLRLALQAFQGFMQENYSHKDESFLETHGRLLFLSFLRPVINGKGFSFKEPVVGNERRMDVVITYNNKRFVLELKRWLGDAYHQKGLQQLSDYLDLYKLKEGFLLIYDFNKNKTYKHESIDFNDKKIFTVWV